MSFSLGLGHCKLQMTPNQTRKLEVAIIGAGMKSS